MTMRFVPSASFALRSALLPIEELTALTDGATAIHAVGKSDADLEAACAVDRRAIEARVRARLESATLREALFLASPSLDEALDGWLRGKDDARAREAFEPALRYFARMAGRATPFGLFSGCSVGRIAERTSLALSPADTARRHVRLDVSYLGAVCAVLAREPAIRDELLYRPNNSLHTTRESYRYVDARTDPATQELTHEVVSVERSPHLDAVLACASEASQGASFQALVAAVRAVDDEVDEEAAREFAAQMIEQQLVVSGLAPTLSGAEPISGVIRALASTRSGAASADRLQSVHGAMRALDAEPLGLSADRYRAVATSLEALPVPIEPSRLFHVDMFKSSPEATLGTAVLREIDRAVSTLERVSRREPNATLARFRAAFRARYGHREVPLLEALDDELGVGLPNERGVEVSRTPLVAGLPFGGEATAFRFGAHDEWLLRNIIARQVARSTEWHLEEDDLARFDAFAPSPAPEAFAFFGSIASASAEALARGDVLVHPQSIVGPSAGALLGRFCHGSSELRQLVEAHLRAEEALRPEAIFAEIVHVPYGRMGNVIARPAMRSYDIPYLGASEKDAAHRIAVQDLRVSLQGDRVVLRSTRLDRQVIPRLSCAHDYDTAPATIYRFLAAAQEQVWCGWSWGALGGAPFLPRVRVGKTVLALARWSLDRDQLRELTEAKTPGARFKAAQRLRDASNMPRWIGLVERDNVLPIDLENVALVEELARTARRKNALRLEELFPAPHEHGAHGPEGRYVHQIVVPLTRPSRVDAPASMLPASAEATFPPGSEWLDALLESDTSEERALFDVVRPWAREELGRGAIDQWQFTRVAGARGLRVRARGEARCLWDEAYPRFLARARVAFGAGLRVTLSTYDPLAEGFASAAARAALDRFFHADSEASLDLMARFEGAASERWQPALRVLHEILAAVFPDIDARTAFVERVARERAPASADFAHAMGARFRRDRRALEQCVDGAPGDVFGGNLVEILDRVGAAARALAAAVSSSDECDAVTCIALSSHLARVLHTEPARQEAVLLDYLQRIYRSQRARARKAH